LIQGGFCAWCSVGSIFAQDISKKSYNVKNVTKVQIVGYHARFFSRNRVVQFMSRTFSRNFGLSGSNGGANIGIVPPIFRSSPASSSFRIRAVADLVSR